MVLEQLDIHMQKKWSWTQTLHLSQNFSQNRYHSPKLKHKTIKLLEDIIGENLHGFGFGGDFLDTISKEKIG